MPASFSTAALKTREQLLQQAQTKDVVWDVVVIGGGATGLGVAFEAATKGYQTLLLEQADFAKGTSSRSTKLVHGGVRYLNQGNIKLVREATVERGLLYKNAPHLVKNQEFVIPVYSSWDHWKYTVGLTLYDWLAGTLSLGKSYGISRSETLKRLPEIEPTKLAGGVVYHANYLKFMERARTEWLRSLGFQQDDLIRSDGVIFAVRSARVEFLRPARFNDQLDVTVALDEDQSVAELYKVTGIPQTVIIAKDGSIQSVHIGVSPGLKSELTHELTELSEGRALVK